MFEDLLILALFQVLVVEMKTHTEVITVSYPRVLAKYEWVSDEVFFSLIGFD